MRSNLFYRLSQKWRYHTSENPFEKQVAEINRFEPLIVLSPTTFKIKGCELVFSRMHHSFITERFVFFETLLKGKGKFKIEGLSLLYVINDITLRIGTSEEMFIVDEIFFEHCYRVVTGWQYSVIDIGMNVGFASLFFAGNPNVSKVYGFEPFRQTFNDATLNFELNPQLAGRITTKNFGLSARTEILTVPYSPDLKGKNSTANGVSGNESIELRNAYEVLSDLIGGDPAEKYFVKMDCEGAEFQIFATFVERRIPQQIFGFIIEWHVMDPKPIVDILISNDFKVQLRGDTEIGLITAFR
jgi:FkbM family methyltransferase